MKKLELTLVRLGPHPGFRFNLPDYSHRIPLFVRQHNQKVLSNPDVPDSGFTLPKRIIGKNRGTFLNVATVHPRRRQITAYGNCAFEDIELNHVALLVYGRKGEEASPLKEGPAAGKRFDLPEYPMRSEFHNFGVLDDPDFILSGWIVPPEFNGGEAGFANLISVNLQCECVTSFGRGVLDDLYPFEKPALIYGGDSSDFSVREIIVDDDFHYQNELPEVLGAIDLYKTCGVYAA